MNSDELFRFINKTFSIFILLYFIVCVVFIVVSILYGLDIFKIDETIYFDVVYFYVEPTLWSFWLVSIIAMFFCKAMLPKRTIVLSITTIILWFLTYFIWLACLL